MVSLDLVMEPVAPVLDFWTFKSGLASFQNYFGWSLVSFPLHFFYHKVNPKLMVHFLFIYLFFSFFFHHTFDKKLILLEFKFKIMSFYIRILTICSILYSSCSNPSMQNIKDQKVLKSENQNKLTLILI